MELGLNLLYASLAVCAFAHWMATGLRGAGRHKHALLLLCALALLFPFVSISDDLSAAPDIVEGTIVSASRATLTLACKEVFLSPPPARDEVPVFAISGYLAPRHSAYLPTNVDSASNGLRSPPLS